MTGVPGTLVAFLAAVTLFVTVLIVVWQDHRIRHRQPEGIERLGQTGDGVTILRVDGRLIELDAPGEESFGKLDKREVAQFRERVVKRQRTKYSRYDFTQWFSHQGHPVIDEPVYVDISVGRTRFWTKSEIARLPMDQRAGLTLNRDLWRWFTGSDGLEAERRLREAEQLLEEGASLVTPRSAGGPPSVVNPQSLLAPALTALVDAESRRNQLPTWAETARSFLAKG